MFKQILASAIALVIVGGVYLAFNPTPKTFGDVLNVPQPATASTTAFTLTTASQRLLASSSARIAAKIDSINCTAGGVAFLKASNDIVATANTGTALLASSTLLLSTFPEAPTPTGAVQGILNLGTCTVIVTEWRKS